MSGLKNKPIKLGVNFTLLCGYEGFLSEAYVILSVLFIFSFLCPHVQIDNHFWTLLSGSRKYAQNEEMMLSLSLLETKLILLRKGSIMLSV